MSSRSIQPLRRKLRFETADAATYHEVALDGWTQDGVTLAKGWARHRTGPVGHPPVDTGELYCTPDPTEVSPYVREHSQVVTTSLEAWLASWIAARQADGATPVACPAMPGATLPFDPRVLERIANEHLSGEARTCAAASDELEAWQQCSRDRSLMVRPGIEMWWEIKDPASVVEIARTFPAPHATAGLCAAFANCGWLVRSRRDDKHTYLVHRTPAAGAVHAVHRFNARELVLSDRWGSIASFVDSDQLVFGAEPPPAQPGHDDPGVLSRRSAWLISAICGLSTGITEEDLAHAGGMDQFASELPILGAHPHLIRYWLLTHAIIGNEESYRATKEAAGDAFDPPLLRLLTEFEQHGSVPLGELTDALLEEIRSDAPDRMFE